MRASATLAFLLSLPALASCGDDDPGTGGTDASPDAAVDANVSLTCSEMETAWNAIVDDLDRSCTAAAECATVGGAQDDVGPTCDCAPAIGGCWRVVQSSAYAGSDAPGIAETYYELCTEGGLCDCGVPEYDCVDNQCVRTEEFNCFPPAP